MLVLDSFAGWYLYDVVSRVLGMRDRDVEHWAVFCALWMSGCKFDFCITWTSKIQWDHKFVTYYRFSWRSQNWIVLSNRHTFQNYNRKCNNLLINNIHKTNRHFKKNWKDRFLHNVRLHHRTSKSVKTSYVKHNKLNYMRVHFSFKRSHNKAFSGWLFCESLGRGMPVVHWNPYRPYTRP